ncbi:MAG: hypothetical protein QM598_05845 [Protaetiibacter sp.]
MITGVPGHGRGVVMKNLMAAVERVQLRRVVVDAAADAPEYVVDACGGELIPRGVGSSNGTEAS